MSANLPQHHSLGNPAGYAIAAKYQTNNKDVSLTPLIEKALKDRALLDQLCDRTQSSLGDLASDRHTH